MMATIGAINLISCAAVARNSAEDDAWLRCKSSRRPSTSAWPAAWLTIRSASSCITPCAAEHAPRETRNAGYHSVWGPQADMAHMAGGTHPPSGHSRQRMRRFHIMGGECNYLLRVTADASKRLEFVPEEQWKSAAMMSWSEEAIQGMLSSAEAVLKETAHRLRLPITVRAMHCRSCPEECSCLRQSLHHTQDGAQSLNEDEGCRLLPGHCFASQKASSRHIIV